MCNCRRHLMMGDWRRRGESLCWLVDLIQTRTSNKMWSFKSFSELIYDQCVTFSCSINQPHISHLHRPIWATCTSFPPPPSPADCSLNEIKWLRGSFWEIQSQMTATNVLVHRTGCSSRVGCKLVGTEERRKIWTLIPVGRAQHNKEVGRCILWIIAAPVHIKSIFSIYQPTTKTRHQKRRREQQQTCRRRCYSIQLELGSLLCSPTQLTDRSMLQSIIE